MPRAVGEGAAYGAALQALWCWKLQAGERMKIEDITGTFVKLNRAQTTQPKAANVRRYAALQALQDETSRALRGVFTRQRNFVLEK